MCNKGCVKKCGCALFLASVALLVLAIVKIVFTDKVGQNEVLNMIAEAVLMNLNEEQKKHMEKLEDKGMNPFKLAGIALAVVTFVGIIFAILSASCASDMCHCKCISAINRLCTLITVTVSAVVFLALGIAMMAIGAAFLAPGQMGSDLINENCAKAQNAQLDQISPPEMQGAFKMFDDLDKGYKEAVNTNMCNDFCACPGKAGDKWYDEYWALEEEYLNKYKRTKNINDPDRKMMIFSPVDDDTTTVEIVKDCLDRTQDAVDAVLTEQVNIAYDAPQNDDGQGGKLRTKEQIKKEFSGEATKVTDKKPDPIFEAIVGALEKKYSCSGTCSSPLFYYSQSVKKGIPKTGCLVPFIEDVGKELNNLGIVMIVTGLLFLSMIFCVIPICCYSTEDTSDDDAEKQKKDMKDKEKKKEGKEGEDFDDPAQMQGAGNDGQANRMDD